MALAVTNGDFKRSQRSDAEALILLRSILDEQDLSQFFLAIKNQLRVTRLSHFDYVKSRDLLAIGMPKPAARRLLNAVRKRRFDRKLEKFGNFIFPRNPRTNTDSFLSERGNLTSTAGYGQASRTGGDHAPSSTVFYPSSSKPEHDDYDTHVSCLISPASIIKGQRLGQGTFGEVFRAEWVRDGRTIPVAIKILKPISSLTNATEALADEFLREVGIMQDLHHKNLIQLYGVCLREPKMIVTELAQTTLLDRLRKSFRHIDINDLLRWAVQICDGMTYLEQRRFIHRDLAARNCLLKDNVVKIGDFGLMKHLSNETDYYVMNAQHKVAFAWCAPESLRHRQFSNKTDVFSYGVTLFEIFSFGEEPWATFSGAQILQLIEREGKRLPKPPACSRTIFQDIMLKCWMLRPEDRPSFADLSKFLPKLFDDHWHFQALHRFSWKEMIRQHLQADFDKHVLEQISGIDFEAGDIVSIIDFDAGKAFCKGQNRRTLDIGYFPRVLVPFKSSSKLAPQISHPVTNSFVHTGHGDGLDKAKWFGAPDAIDEIYLKNPVLPNDADLLTGFSSTSNGRNGLDQNYLAVIKSISSANNSWQNQFPGLADELVQFSAVNVVPSTPAALLYSSFNDNRMPSPQLQQRSHNLMPSSSYANAGFCAERDAAFQPSSSAVVYGNSSVPPISSYSGSSSVQTSAGQDLLKFENEIILEKFDCHESKPPPKQTETSILDQSLTDLSDGVEAEKVSLYSTTPKRTFPPGTRYENFAAIQNGAAALNYTPQPKYYNLIGFDPKDGFFEKQNGKNNPVVNAVKHEPVYVERCSSLTHLNSAIHFLPTNTAQQPSVAEQSGRQSPFFAVTSASATILPAKSALVQSKYSQVGKPAANGEAIASSAVSSNQKPTSILEDLLHRVIAATPQNDPVPLNVERARDALKRSHFSVEAAVVLLKAEKLHRIFSSLSIEQCRQCLAENDNDVDRAASVLIDRLPR